MKRTFGLRAALTVLVLVAIAPVFAIVVKSSVSERHARLGRAEASLHSVVALAAAHQERLVDGAREMLAAIAFSPALVGGRGAECVHYMKRLQANAPVTYGTFGVLDAGGNLTCRSEPTRVLVNSSDRRFFRTAIETGRFTVGEHLVSRASGKSVLPFAWPVYADADGVLQGVAFLALDVERSAEHLRHIELPPEMGLFVADADGKVLAASGVRPAATGEPLPEAFLRAALKDGATGGRAAGTDGSEWLYQVRSVGHAREGRLFVAGLMSVDDVLDPATDHLRMQVAALALVALLAAALAWNLGDRVLARPMQRLLERVEALGREDVDLRRPPEPTVLTELSELDRRFHAMARALLERSVQRDGALAEIAGQNRLLESIFESMAEGVIVLDAKGRFLHVNPAALRIMPGLAEMRHEREPMGTEPRDWGVFHLDGSAVDARDRPIARVLRGEDVDFFRLLLRGRLTHGEEKFVQGRARHLVSADGRRYGAVVVYSDITAEYRAQQELLRMNETLERRVAERTHELAIANRELESFSYSVSHDLRAPLQAIDGFGRALMARHLAQLDDKARHYLERITDNTRQMGALIDDLLSLSRVTRAQLRMEPVDLAPRAHAIVEQLRQRDPGRRVDVAIDPSIPCAGDPGLLAILLDNLIGNAWKFTAHRAEAVIRVGSTVAAGGERTFHVADNGAGFEMAHAAKLFSPFQRLHTASEFPGTGIGLATVHRIVTRHGGRVWAEAAPGEGATFRFTLHGEQDEKQPDPPRRGQPRPPGADAHDAGGEQRPQ